jgi:pilus assembly protein FimV
VATSSEGPGFLEALMDDNPWALAGGAGLIALLAGFGLYRFTRPKKDSGETSFLESRLQPDSFFGASGGQRIDTRDAGAASSSSMSYSLSQLDAIGDVDPVAEADVYLAYGRDLQAEEILKEAMRSNPDRMAIRSKLLEVYAKRRDTKGFELLATQMYTLTNGQGEDWIKAQEAGLQIDPDNPLYQPGGAPVLVHGSSGQVVEPLGATTMPQSVLPSPSQYGAGAAAPFVDSSSVDLDLDLGDVTVPPSGTQPGSFESVSADSAEQASAEAPMLRSVDDQDFTLPPEPRGVPSISKPMEFDLSGISLDLDKPPGEGASESGPDSESGFADLDLSLPEGDAASDPLARKLELAEAFSQIGDVEGARELLNEVIASSEGALKSKATSMLADLA